MCHYRNDLLARVGLFQEFLFPFDAAKVDRFSIASNFFSRFIRFSALFLIYVKNMCAHTSIYALLLIT